MSVWWGVKREISYRGHGSVRVKEKQKQKADQQNTAHIEIRTTIPDWYGHSSKLSLTAPHGVNPWDAASKPLLYPNTIYYSFTVKFSASDVHRNSHMVVIIKYSTEWSRTPSNTE
jgi:hypothetical protein